jgi:PAS domain S-box-containing protein
MIPGARPVSARGMRPSHQRTPRTGAAGTVEHAAPKCHISSGGRTALAQLSRLHLDAPAPSSRSRPPPVPDAEFEQLFRRIPQPAWVYDVETLGFLEANDAAVRTYGWSREELLRMTILDLRTPEDSRRLAEELRDTPPQGLLAGQTWRHRRRDGSPIDVEVAADAVTFRGRPARVVVAQDVTARVVAEAATRHRGALLEMLAAVAVGANEAATVEEAVRVCQDRVCATTGWAASHAFLADGAGTLHPTGWWCFNGPREAEALVRETAALRLAPGEGPPGRALARGAPVWLEDLSREPTFRRSDAARRAGLAAAVAVPVLLGRQAAAVLEFFAAGPIARDADTADALSHLAAQIARVMERARAGEALRRSEEHYRSLTENASDVVLVVDAEARVLYASPSLERLLGRLPVEVVGRSVLEFVHPDDHAAVGARFAARLREPGVVAVSETRFLHRDGTPRVVEAVGRNRLDDPAVRGVVYNARDVTERRAMEQALRSTAGELSALLGALPDVVLVLDADGRVERVAPTAYPLPEAGELQGALAARWVGDDEAERFVTLIRHVLKTGLTGRVEYQIAPEGRGRWFTAQVAPLGEGRVLWVASDDTERHRAREMLEKHAAELARSNRELQEFAYVASHDLQEPLRKVQAFGDRLARRAEGGLDATSRDYLARMQAAAARMQGLIHDLLAFARVATEARPPVPVRLERAAREAVADLSARLAETNGTVEIGPLPDARADPVQVRRVLQNLVGNALKFHRPGEPPRVSVTGRLLPAPRPADARVEVTVADRGIGFEPRHADRIFSPFQRLHGRGEYDGTGMGLAICRRIVERHGGTIVARGRPGEGSEFVFTLPAATGAGAEESP